MDPEITPSEIRHAEFRNTLRGLDRSEVEQFLTRLANVVEGLQEQNRRLVAAAAEIPDRDLEHEFETIGREVTDILQSAREAAESMRERAALDAARWRSEAMEEADKNRKDAAADSEALRRDAWTTGTAMLTQAAEEARKMREQADRDVLTIQGEAEREAHRLTSGARREAEDLVRSATMDAEKTTSDAAKRRDEIIDQANRQAAAAQERARALEQRRDELMDELENVRSTLSRLEGSLDEKREILELSSEESTSVRVVPSIPPSEDPDHWSPGETVRVIRGEDEEPAPVVDIDLPTQDPEDFAKSVEPVAQPRPAVEVIPASSEPDRVDESGATESRTADEERGRVAEDDTREGEPGDRHRDASAAEDDEKPVSEHPDVPSAAEDDDDVSALFDSLRGSGAEEPVDEGSLDMAGTEEPSQNPEGVTEEEDEEDTQDSRDWIEIRNTRLLPITNRALRGAKKSLTELQNIALDGLRTDDEWRPGADEIAETLQAELIAVWSESFAAGHMVAEEMTSTKIKRPPTPPSESVPDFAHALASALGSALEEAEGGQRARQAAVSRVFRVWRADEAERRIRELAIRSYQLGVERTVEADVTVG